MPVRKVSDNPDCYQWGNQKIYCGKGAKEKAIKQGIAIVNTGWREAEGEIKKIPIEDIEIGSILIFPSGPFVLNEKEIDGGKVKVLVNPFHQLKGISDIQGEIKLGTKFEVSTPRKELLKKRFGYGAETFSAEKVKKEILEDDWQGLKIKFIYKDREGKLVWSDNDEGKGGVLSFGDDPFKKEGERMSRLPHTQTIEDIRSKLEAKEVFKIMMDKPCQSCGDAIHKKGIGSCGWCEDDLEVWDMKFDPDKDINDNKWWDRQAEKGKIFLLSNAIFKNPYCRDCLYYYDGMGNNYPNKFDRESANYWLGNAVCERHWAEIVADGGLSKDTKRHSLYEIENISPRERMMKKRFGFGAENYRENRLRQRFGLPKLLKIGGKWPYEGETGKIMRDWYVILEEVNNPKTDVTYYGFTGKGKIHLIYPVWDCGCGKNDCERCNKITPHYWKYCDGESDKKQFTGQLYRVKKLEVDGGGIRKITGIDKAKYYLGQRGKLCKVCDRNTEQYGRIEWGAENKTTNKVLVVGCLIAGLIGLNKLLGK